MGDLGPAEIWGGVGRQQALVWADFNFSKCEVGRLLPRAALFEKPPGQCQFRGVRRGWGESQGAHAT